MKNISFFLISVVVSAMLAGCAVQKDYQGKITRDFTAIAGASGKLKNDSLFRKTTVTLSTYSEFVSLYNLQKAPKPIAQQYAGSFGNYAGLLDNLATDVQNNTPGYEANYAKTMNFIIADVSDKNVGLCPKCQVNKYQPVLVAVKITAADKSGKELSGYTAVMEPALSSPSTKPVRFNKLGDVKQGIVPGYYKIRVEKDGKTLVEKREHVKNQTETVVIHIQV